MTTVVPAFGDFFTEVYGHRPFPWQEELTRRVLDDGAWPAAIDIPTGLGKTSLLAISCYVAAATGCEPGSPGRRRTFFVIDRRVVVDEAFTAAERLAQALHAPDGREAVGAIAERLRSLCGEPDGKPLEAERMRGGLSWHWRWLDRVDRPAVVVGTVDQLGSRLLFRAYNLGENLRPIDAALVGNDSLIVVDEAHLSQPLIETLAAIGDLDVPSIAPRPIVVPMSATVAGRVTGFVQRVSEDDRTDDVAGRRLRAAKELHLVEVTGSARDRAARTEAIMAELARDAVTTERAAAVGVVCNTVRRARAVFDQLRSDPPPEVEVHLLTGRIRPYDRERVQAEVLAVAGAGRERSGASRTIVVATQTIEVGANLDFDELITESAPLDSLIQRLGRLNRFGDRDEARAVAVHDGLDSPVYGEPRTETWTWLADSAPVVETRRPAVELAEGLAVGPDDLAALLQDVDQSELVQVPNRTPVLQRSYLDVWCQTSPTPTTDIPVAPFLHGYGEPERTVSIVWRSDLDVAASDQWSDIVGALPPSAGEALEVPIAECQRWLWHLSAGRFGDVRSVVSEEPDDSDEAAPRCPVLVWRGPDDAVVARTVPEQRRIRPGDVVVVPSTAGGCDRYGWAPTSTALVEDLADLASARPTVRVEPLATLDQTLELLNSTGADLSRARKRLEESVRRWREDEDADLLAEAIVGFLEDLPPAISEALVPRTGSGSWSTPRVLSILGEGSGPTVAIWPTPRDPARDRFALADHASDEGLDPASSSLSPARSVTLADHQAAVAERARSMCRSLGLDDELTDAVVRAAGWHDLGKLDPRFQIMLHGGDDLAALAAIRFGEPIAKSGMDPADRAARRRAQRASGLPPGFRHEAGSAALVAELVDDQDGIDGELVRHLVGAHHGRNRPLLPPVVDDTDEVELTWEGVSVRVDRRCTVDWTAPSRFRDLNQRYGPWGLALLETIVRLADIGCSAEGS